MSHFVLDASVALAWFVDRSIDTYAVRVQERLLPGDRAVAPLLWRVEIANGFVVAERRGTLTAPDIEQAMEKLEALRDRAIDYSEEAFALRRLLATAREFRLTAYDAEYLETARDRHLPLATLDNRLKEAATQAGVELLR